MSQAIAVQFKRSGKLYDFSPGDHAVDVGDHVIVETSRGVEFATVVGPLHEVDEAELASPLREILRVATENDCHIHRVNVEKAAEAFDICLERIAERELEMKLVDVEYTFDNAKIIFYFTADGRIDFRELVKDLASVFHTRIELRQIGVRDEAKIIGGIGICGRTLCCHSFLDEFSPVSIKMAKEQGLSLNPSKISGCCGRLLCCLTYENDNYVEWHKTCPNCTAADFSPRKKEAAAKAAAEREALEAAMDSIETVEQDASEEHAGKDRAPKGEGKKEHSDKGERNNKSAAQRGNHSRANETEIIIENAEPYEDKPARRNKRRPNDRKQKPRSRQSRDKSRQSRGKSRNRRFNKSDGGHE